MSLEPLPQSAEAYALALLDGRASIDSRRQWVRCCAAALKRHPPTYGTTADGRKLYFCFFEPGKGPRRPTGKVPTGLAIQQITAHLDAWWAILRKDQAARIRRTNARRAVRDATRPAAGRLIEKIADATRRQRQQPQQKA